MAADSAFPPVTASAPRPVGGDRRIAVLPPEEARKIAAGEVVDRPAALVREFLDNAIDAGGRRIEVYIDGGGCRRVEVDDDGEGMDKENLELCTFTHATSKIRSLEDLNSAKTLGFRGEALAAAAAVAALEIVSSAGGREAWKLLAGPGGNRPPRIEPGSRGRGSRVRASGVFDTIPARKRFLKREGSEALLCRQAFIDKALAFPEIDFRFIQDGVLKVSLPQAESYKERFAAALLNSSPAHRPGTLYEIYALGEGFRITLVVGGPELYRNDRRQQFVFANRRRIQDYSLLQALEYGVQGWFPNGLHPVGALYIDIDPALADFNIHPAKREARFTDPGALHHAASTALREFLRGKGGLPNGGPLPQEKPLFPGFGGPAGPADSAGNSYPQGAGSRSPAAERLALEALLANPPDFAPLPGRGNSETAAEAAPPYGAENLRNSEAGVPAGNEGGPGLRFIGRVFGLFLLAERGERLYIIDQHAAHERILYDRILASPPARQELLVPINFDAEDPAEDRFLRVKGEEMAKLGVMIEEEGNGRWQITALPEGWRLSDSETLEALRDLQNAGESMAERWAATLSCRRAVKDGDYLDDLTASAMAEAALALPIPRCPHGRPIWVEISRAELYRGVKRS